MIAKRQRQQVEQTHSAQKLHKTDVIHALVDWKTWVTAVAQFSSNVMLYRFSTFLPTIIRGIDPSWSTPTVQGLTVPCYFLGGSTFMVVAYFSDRYQRRGLPTVIFGTISLAGYALLMGANGAEPRYAGCYLAAMGLYGKSKMSSAVRLGSADCGGSSFCGPANCLVAPQLPTVREAHNRVGLADCVRQSCRHCGQLRECSPCSHA